MSGVVTRHEPIYAWRWEVSGKAR